MQRISILTGAILGALGVIIGALGAHIFKARLEHYQRIATFETGVKYHFFHALALILLGLLMDKYHSGLLGYSMWAYLAGIFIFSGSIYILSLTGNTMWGAVTPFGGLFLSTGWVLLFLGVLKGKQ